MLIKSAQLGRQNEEAFGVLQKYYDSIQGSTRQGGLHQASSAAEIVDLIKTQIGFFEVSSIILDGLDECGDNIADVLELWIRIISEGTGVVRTVVASRELDMIQRRLVKLQYHSISIAAQRTDLRLFVAAELEIRSKRDTAWVGDDDLKDHIMKKLVEGADGM
jgi:hypothetical protein